MYRVLGYNTDIHEVPLKPRENNILRQESNLSKTTSLFQ